MHYQFPFLLLRNRHLKRNIEDRIVESFYQSPYRFYLSAVNFKRIQVRLNSSNVEVIEVTVNDSRNRIYLDYILQDKKKSVLSHTFHQSIHQADIFFIQSSASSSFLSARLERFWTVRPISYYTGLRRVHIVNGTQNVRIFPAVAFLRDTESELRSVRKARNATV